MDICKIFEKKRFVFVRDSLGSIGTDLNEFTELMRRYNLNILNGCEDPDTCQCKYRHKRCRMFMIRKLSTADSFEFYSPSCNKVEKIIVSQKDIDDKTDLYNFMNLFHENFSDCVMNLVNYVDFIIDPHQKMKYIADVLFIADPYYTNYRQYQSNGYGHNIEIEKPDSDIDAVPEDKRSCSLNWHRDMYRQSSSNETQLYDYVALFILNVKNISPHKLMIAKFNETDEMAGKISSIDIDENVTGDIGYIIDQNANLFHRHSDFVHQNIDARRNVIAIRFKYIN